MVLQNLPKTWLQFQKSGVAGKSHFCPNCRTETILVKFHSLTLIPENKKEVEKKVAVKPVETKNKFSQAKLLAGAVKHKSSESGGNSVKRLKSDPDPDDKNQEAASCVSLGSTSLSGPSIHCPSAAVCVGILPGLGAYSGSSDSESSSDSEGTINATGKIVSSIFRTNTFLEAP
ncbi:PSME3-interacting protein [Manis javanica]|nr:PSME3-interacting protein [Manis javanica]